MQNTKACSRGNTHGKQASVLIECQRRGSYQYFHFYASYCNKPEQMILYNLKIAKAAQADSTNHLL